MKKRMFFMFSLIMFLPFKLNAQECILSDSNIQREIELIGIDNKDDVINAKIKYFFNDKSYTDTEQILDKISCNKEKCIITIPINTDKIDSGTSIKSEIIVQTKIDKYKYEDEFDYIKKDTIKIVSLNNEEINLNNKDVIELKYKISDLTAQESSKLKLELKINNKDYLSINKDNEFIFNIPAKELSVKKLNIKVSVKNVNKDISLNEKIKFINDQKLIKYNFFTKSVTVTEKNKKNISLMKKPLDYNCNNEQIKILNENIADYKDGYIYGKEAGKTYLKAKCDNKVAIAEINVIAEPVTLKFAKNTDFIELDDTKKVPIKIKQLNKNFKRSDIVWNTSDFLIASVNENGELTAYNEGDVDVEMFYNGENYKMTYKVIPPVEEILTNVNGITLQKGQQAMVAAKTKPYDITEYQDIMYYIKNPEIISYNDGIITAIKEGYTEFVYKYKNIEKSIPVTVEKTDDEKNDFSLSNNNIELKKNEMYDIKNSFITNGVDYNDLAFVSANNKIASVDASGKILANNEGVTLIIIKSKTTTQYFKITVN